MKSVVVFENHRGIHVAFPLTTTERPVRMFEESGYNDITHACVGIQFWDYGLVTYEPIEIGPGRDWPDSKVIGFWDLTRMQREIVCEVAEEERLLWRNN